MSDYLKKRQQNIFDGRPIPENKKYKINPISDKRAAKLKEQKEAGSDSEMDMFFQSQRPKMTGKCLFCGGKSQKHDDDNYFFSIAHLLPKRDADKGGFPSVAIHEDNWIELCHFNNSCHTNFDTGQITWEFIKDSKEWLVIREKLLNVLPMVAESERKNKLYSKLNELLYGKTN